MMVEMMMVVMMMLEMMMVMMMMMIMMIMMIMTVLMLKMPLDSLLPRWMPLFQAVTLHLCHSSVAEHSLKRIEKSFVDLSSLSTFCNFVHSCGENHRCVCLLRIMSPRTMSFSRDSKS